ncbi:hypothetical protein [Streptomyces sp. NPDC018693]|uniref:DUF7848 domain-containing protein n=1 Tax=unclassified Streptomyces TaxID=2593676 RepID=UPI0037943CF1
MAGVKDYTYTHVPADVRLTVEKLDDLATRRWVECASCPESRDITAVREADKWVTQHFADNPHHDRYRLKSETGWRFVPTSANATTAPEASECGVATALPDDTVEFQKEKRGRDLSGVFVVCGIAPHGDEEDHRGPVYLDGRRIGIFTWASSPPP